MSKKHPIIAVTGSSGAGTMPVKVAFKHIFFRHKLNPVIIDGDSFHRYDRYEMHDTVRLAEAEGKNLSHFGPEANLLDQLEMLFRQYSESGRGRRRFYLHTEKQASDYNQQPGTFTPWEEIDAGSDLLFYQGLHGGMVNAEVDIAQFADLLIGVAPIVNLEWIQKIHRDTAERGYAPEDVTDIILRRMPDYMRHITPQFSRTDINFQRIPTVDTSNPFTVRDAPTLDESHIIINFHNPAKFDLDFHYLMRLIHGSFSSRRNTLVIPGGKLELIMEILFTPIVEGLVKANA
ncbi:MAG: phosphoribulokinase [Gammaproteobacteria bacterium]|nr:phosphoribulokinase [Gammaproteobacteria bacterium]